jgi:cellulose synthase (UDP-forming)
MVDRRTEQMNPRLILALWRERWGKDDARSAKTLNRKGRLAAWGDRLAESLVWSWPGVVTGTFGVCVLLFALIVLAPFSQNSQLLFSFLLICMAIYARRYAGAFVTQLLIGLSFISSARYLYWRFSATLGQNLDLDFVLGFCLCVAELYLCLLICVGFMQNLWPLKQASTLLPNDSTEWPTVDVFIPGHGRSYSSIKSSVMAALALDWPKKKIKTYILDDGHRDDINNLADSLGVLYKSFPDNLEDIAGSINFALADSKGELVAIFDGDEVPDQHFLRVSAGWFLSDLKLGMIQTPNHFLVPAPSRRSLPIFDAPNLGGSCALIRRSMLLAAGGVSTGSVGRHIHTALNLQEQGYTNAYIGFSRSEETAEHKQMASIGKPGPSSLQIFRVDHPFWGGKLRWRQQLASLQTMLQFYYTVPRLIFLTAPLAYLLLEANIIQTSVALFAAYVLPHLMLAHLAQARMQGDTRFPMWVDIRETMLAWYMLFPTAITLVRTKIAGYVRAFREGRVKQDDPFDWMIAVPFAALVLLNLAGLVVGIVRLLSSGAVDHEVVIPYLLWTVYNLMILSAVLAVAEESRYILKYRRWQLRMPAMIKLPLGRSLFCTTVNFPEPSLVFALPGPADVETGSELHVSIFRGYREYLFSARVVSVDEGLLRVDIEESAQNDYRSLGIAVFSRGQDWPKWLPGRDADHPLPVWMVNAFNVVHIAVLGFIKPLGESVLGTRLGGWIQIWKKRK